MDLDIKGLRVLVTAGDISRAADVILSRGGLAG